MKAQAQRKICILYCFSGTNLPPWKACKWCKSWQATKKGYRDNYPPYFTNFFFETQNTQKLVGSLVGAEARTSLEVQRMESTNDSITFYLWQTICSFPEHWEDLHSSFYNQVQNSWRKCYNVLYIFSSYMDIYKSMYVYSTYIEVVIGSLRER